MFVVVNEIDAAGGKERTAIRADAIHAVTACMTPETAGLGAQCVIITIGKDRTLRESAVADSFDDIMAAIHDVGYCVVDAGTPRAAEGDKP